MRDATLPAIIIHHLMENLPGSDSFVNSFDQPCMNQDNYAKKCEGFLCGKECNDIDNWASEHSDPIGQTNYQVVLSLSYIIILAGKSSDINKTLISALDKCQIRDWSSCLDRRQVWNQKRPPWYEAIIHLIYPILDPIVHMLVSAVQTGASTYQAMSLSISCFSEMWDCIPDCLYTVTTLLTEIIPADTKPLGDSVLIQILFSALYTKLLEASTNETEKEKNVPTSASGETSSSSGTSIKSKSSICHILAEAICFIDEDNKHTDQIQLFINQTRESQRPATILDTDGEDGGGLSFVSTSKIDDLEGNVHRQPSPSTRTEEEFDVENAEYISEMLVSDILSTSVGKQSMKMIYKYIKNNIDWLLQKMGVSEGDPTPCEPNPGQKLRVEKPHLLHLMFHIGMQPFDQLLTGSLNIDYTSWFQTPMSLNAEKAWLQIAQRYEFQESTRLTVHEAVMVSYISSQLKP